MPSDGVSTHSSDGSGPDQRPALVLLAHGSPGSEEDLRGFLTRMRDGMPPREREVRYLAARYEEAEWPSAGVAAMESLARRLGEELHTTCVCAFRYVEPGIGETLAGLESQGFDEAIVTTLSPFPGRYSSDGYAQVLAQELAERELSIGCLFVHGWWQDARVIEALAEKLGGTLDGVADDKRPAEVVFTAHSLPLEGLPDDDPYVPAYEATCRQVAEAAGLSDDGWSVSYQSAAAPVGWLQPDVGAAMAEAAAGGARTVVLAPLGFLFDNLEVTWGLDVEAARLADELGVQYRRVPMLNDHPALVQTLADFLSLHQAQA